jgi:hypothetical protein
MIDFMKIRNLLTTGNRTIDQIYGNKSPPNLAHGMELSKHHHESNLTECN